LLIRVYLDDDVGRRGDLIPEAEALLCHHRAEGQVDFRVIEEFQED
jgi:hypothetical protein